MNPTTHELDQNAIAEPKSEPGLPPAGLRVMCVDDNEDAADSLGLLLSMVACEVAVAHDAVSALAIVDRFRPQVCVLDISLNEPDWDGCKLAQAIRAKPFGEQVLLIALTALSDYRALSWIADSDFDLYFTKPVDPKELYAAFNNFVVHGRPQNV